MTMMAIPKMSFFIHSTSFPHQNPDYLQTLVFSRLYTVGRLAYNGEKMKVKTLTGAVSYPYILKVQKSAESAFQSQKICGKCA